MSDSPLNESISPEDQLQADRCLLALNSLWKKFKISEPKQGLFVDPRISVIDKYRDKLTIEAILNSSTVMHLSIERTFSKCGLEIIVQVPKTRERAILGPDRSWNGSNRFWYPPIEGTEPLEQFIQDMYEAITLCALGRFHGIAGTKERCDTCRHQLHCIAQNW